MNKIYIDFLLNIKKEFKNGNLIFFKTPTTSIINLEKLDMYQEITSYILYLWYVDTKDDRMNNTDYIIIPKNIERTFYFDQIEFLEIAQILAYIKYNLLNEILDKLTYETFNKKNINKYKVTKLKKLLKDHNINFGNINKKECVSLLLKNKDKIFK